MNKQDSFSTDHPISLLRKFGGSISAYGAGMMVTSVMGIMLLPVFLRYLSPEKYGIWALTRIIPPILISIISLDLSGAVLRLYYDWKKEGVEKESVFTVWIFTIVWSGMLVAIFLLFSENLFSFFFKNVKFDPFIKLTLIAEGINLTSGLAMKLLRIKDEAKNYATLNIMHVLITMCCIIYFVSNSGGVEGALYGTIIANSIMFLFFSYVMIKNSKFAFSSKALVAAMSYSLPLVPGNIVNNVFSVLDRLFLDKFLPASQIGIYAVARTIANILNMLLGVFQLAIMPFFIRIASERSDSKVLLSKSAEYLFGFLIIFGFSISIYAPEIIMVLGKSVYFEAHKYVGPLTFAFMTGAFTFLPELQISLSKKTKYASMVYATKFIIFSLLGFILMQNYGVGGAITTYIVVNLLSFILYFRIGQRCYPVEIDIGKLIIMPMLAIFVWYFVSMVLPPTALFRYDIVALKSVSVIIVAIIMALYFGITINVLKASLQKKAVMQ